VSWTAAGPETVALACPMLTGHSSPIAFQYSSWWSDWSLTTPPTSYDST
jgi:hypothetical protein